MCTFIAREPPYAKDDVIVRLDVCNAANSLQAFRVVYIADILAGISTVFFESMMPSPDQVIPRQAPGVTAQSRASRGKGHESSEEE
jgi:hypothetical protein